jgi:hypothetical protein
LKTRNIEKQEIDLIEKQEIDLIQKSRNTFDTKIKKYI